MDEKATDDVRSRLVDGGECQKLPRHSKGASQDPYNIERNGRRRGGGSTRGEEKEGRKRTVCHRLGASLPSVGASSTLCGTGTEQGTDGRSAGKEPPSMI